VIAGNPKRASAINRHGTASRNRVREIRRELGSLLEETDRLDKLMGLSGLDENEDIPIDGDRKWSRAFETAHSFLRGLEQAVAKHQIQRLRRPRALA
jgi:hypothetical protein